MKLLQIWLNFVRWQILLFQIFCCAMFADSEDTLIIHSAVKYSQKVGIFLIMKLPMSAAQK